MKLWISLASEASDEAKRHGLHHAGFGWYANAQGVITHRTVRGKLVRVVRSKKSWFAKTVDAVKNLGRSDTDAKYAGTKTQFGTYSSGASHVKKFLKWSAGKFLTQRLTDSEKASLREYKGPGYSHINDHMLRKTNRVMNLKYSSEQLRQHVSNLDSALAKARLPENVVVFRGMEIPEKYDSGNVQDLVGKGLDDPAYLSTTTNPRMAGFYCRNKKNKRSAVVRMTLPKGSPALPLAGSTTGNSNLEDECEILCPRGTSMVIHKVEEVDDPDQWPPAQIIHVVPVFPGATK